MAPVRSVSKKIEGSMFSESRTMGTSTASLSEGKRKFPFRFVIAVRSCIVDAGRKGLLGEPNPCRKRLSPVGTGSGSHFALVKGRFVSKVLRTGGLESKAEVSSANL